MRQNVAMKVLYATAYSGAMFGTAPVPQIGKIVHPMAGNVNLR